MSQPRSHNILEYRDSKFLMSVSKIHLTSQFEGNYFRKEKGQDENCPLIVQ